jgi:hypothetical protein
MSIRTATLAPGANSRSPVAGRSQRQSESVGMSADRTSDRWRTAPIVWVVFAVVGAALALGSLATRPACAPGSARLFDLTPALPYFFATLAAIGAVAVVVLRGRLRVVVGLVGLMTTCFCVAVTIAIVIGDIHTGSHCWTF